MKHALFVAFLLVLPGSAGAQYSIRSPYLADPSLAIGYVDSCAAFWVHAYDSTYGGFYTNVDRYGNVIPAWGLNKNLVTTSRDAYGFTRAFMLTGKEMYLVMARRALTFLYQHAWDVQYGGWHSTIDRFGNAVNPTEDKTAFDHHYALLGIAASFEATRDTADWRWLMQGYRLNDANLWDSSAQSFGYFDHASYNWQSHSGKSFNATVDAITTHVLALYLLTGDEEYRVRLRQLARNMLDHLVGSMSQQAMGFVESFGTDWNWDDNPANYNTRTIMGHVLKTGWCFGRLQQLLPDTSYIPAAQRLVADVLQHGYDHDFGGPYNSYDRVTGQMIMYGQTDTAKAWWQMEQAVTGGLMLYDLTQDTGYLQMADETLGFFMKYFVDHEYGEVYSDRTRYGGQIWGLEKGNSSKAAYHSTELGYYVYLYGSLFLHHQPVTLHYMFMADTADRMLSMNPVAYPAQKYMITEVRRNDSLYGDYTALDRRLHLAPGVGGHFTVIYAPVAPQGIASGGSLPLGWSLSQNYPNPFNPGTVIRYSIPAESRVRLEIYTVLGGVVATLVDEIQPPGVRSIEWNASNLASGVYFYRLEAASVKGGHESFTQVKKMLLVR